MSFSSFYYFDKFAILKIFNCFHFGFSYSHISLFPTSSPLMCGSELLFCRSVVYVQMVSKRFPVILPQKRMDPLSRILIKMHSGKYWSWFICRTTFDFESTENKSQKQLLLQFQLPDDTIKQRYISVYLNGISAKILAFSRSLKTNARECVDKQRDMHTLLQHINTPLPIIYPVFCTTSSCEFGDLIVDNAVHI